MADGFIWGRGALDDKASLMGILESVEALIEEGFIPKRTIYLAFGQDEEVGGEFGAQAIAHKLESQNEELELVLGNTEKSSIASYYRQFSTNNKIKIIKLKQILSVCWLGPIIRSEK